MTWFSEFLEGTGKREAATTMVMVRTTAKDHERARSSANWWYPSLPDEARTFGMDALFRKFGIYSRVGQTYDAADSDVVLYYREAVDGQLIEEGITEAGAMASFIAAGTAYATHGVNAIPFFFFYSMFGFQRIGDLIWQNADSRGRGFLIGGTAGRTTLAGEGLQHQDGHSHLLASTVPTLRSYDPAFSFEIAVIVQDGLRRMYTDGESLLLLPHRRERDVPHARHAGEGVEEGIRRGNVPLQSSPSSTVHASISSAAAPSYARH